VRTHSDRYAQPLLILGCMAGCAYNFAKWQRDRRRAQAVRAARKAASPPLRSTPRVTIIVAAWNEGDLIGRHIASIQSLRYPNLEYVICAGGEDGTYEQVKRHERPDFVVLEQGPGEGQQAAASRCFKVATGGIVFFTDADCVVDDICLYNAIAPVINEGEFAVTGGYMPLEEQRSETFVIHRWAASTYRYSQAGRYVRGLTGANTAARADVIRQSRAFEEPASIGMDYHLAVCLLDQGYRLHYQHGGTVAMRFESTFRAYSRQRARWLEGILLYALRFRAWDQVATVAVFYAVGLATLLLPVTALMVGRSALALWAVGMICAIMNRVRYLRFLQLSQGVSLAGATYAACVFYAPRDLAALGFSILKVLVPGARGAW